MTDLNYIYDVLVLSADGDTKLVMNGVTHGACDYLLKPVRIEELKNIWQHVVRRKNSDGKDQNKASNEKAPNVAGEGSQGLRSENSADQNKRLGKKRKDQSKEEEEEDGEGNGDDDDPSAQKKPRVVWSVELHRKFVVAVNSLGLDSEFATMFLICLTSVDYNVISQHEYYMS